MGIFIPALKVNGTSFFFLLDRRLRRQQCHRVTQHDRLEDGSPPRRRYTAWRGTGLAPCEVSTWRMSVFLDLLIPHPL